MYYSIGEVANMSGINISTLRYYDKEGLFPTMGRSNGGIRVFTDKEIGTLKIIECLKSTGLSIKDIKRYMDWSKEGNASLEQRREMFYDRLEAVKQQLEEVQKTKELIEFKCWYYDMALEVGSEQEVLNTPIDEMPDELQDAAHRLYEHVDIAR